MLKEKIEQSDYLNEPAIFLGKREYTSFDKKTNEQIPIIAFTYYNIASGEVGEVSIRRDNLTDGRGADQITFADDGWNFKVFVIIREEKRSRFGSNLTLTQIKDTGKYLQLVDHELKM